MAYLNAYLHPPARLPGPLHHTSREQTGKVRALHLLVVNDLVDDIHNRILSAAGALIHGIERRSKRALSNSICR